MPRSRISCSTVRQLIAARELHRLDVLLAAPRVDGQQLGRRVHRAVAEVVRGRLVAEAAGAEMDADPDAVLLVAEEVDVVVPAPHRAELLGGEVEQGAL